eukprot:9684361-Lingulodinium_polyedra.AAC.1
MAPLCISLRTDSDFRTLPPESTLLQSCSHFFFSRLTACLKRRLSPAEARRRAARAAVKAGGALDASL